MAVNVSIIQPLKHTCQKLLIFIALSWSAEASETNDLVLPEHTHWSEVWLQQNVNSSPKGTLKLPDAASIGIISYPFLAAIRFGPKPAC
jgi:hypothetical protein